MSSERTDGLMIKEPLTRVTEVSLERAGSRSEVLKIDSDGNVDREPGNVNIDLNPNADSGKADLYNLKNGNIDSGLNKTDTAKELLKRAFTEGMIDPDMMTFSAKQRKIPNRGDPPSSKKGDTSSKLATSQKPKIVRQESDSKVSMIRTKAIEVQTISVSQNLFESILSSKDRLPRGESSKSPPSTTGQRFPAKAVRTGSSESPTGIHSSPLLQKYATVHQASGKSKGLGTAMAQPKIPGITKYAGPKPGTPKSVTSDSLEHLDVRPRSSNRAHMLQITGLRQPEQWPKKGQQLHMDARTNIDLQRIKFHGDQRTPSKIGGPVLGWSDRPASGLLPKDGILSEQNIRKRADLSPNNSKLKALKKPSSEYSLRGIPLSRPNQKTKRSPQENEGTNQRNKVISGGSAKVIRSMAESGFVGKLRKHAKPSIFPADGEEDFSVANLNPHLSKLKVPRTLSGYSAALATSKGSETRQMSEDETPQRKKHKEPEFFGMTHREPERQGSFHGSIKKVANKELLNKIKPRSYSRPKVGPKADISNDLRKMSYCSFKLPVGHSDERKSYNSRATCPEDINQISTDAMSSKSPTGKYMPSPMIQQRTPKEKGKRTPSTEGLKLDNQFLQAELLNFNQIFAKLKVLATKNSRTLHNLHAKHVGGSKPGLFNFGLDKFQVSLGKDGNKTLTSRPEAKAAAVHRPPSSFVNTQAKVVPTAANTAKSSFLQSQSQVYSKRTPVSIFKDSVKVPGEVTATIRRGSAEKHTSEPLRVPPRPEMPLVQDRVSSPEQIRRASSDLVSHHTGEQLVDDLEQMYRETIRRAATIYKEIYKDECAN